MFWKDAIQQFVDATHRELIDTSVIDKCKNQESEFEQLIKARYILESPKTNMDVPKCIFQILKQ